MTRALTGASPFTTSALRHPVLRLAGYDVTSLFVSANEVLVELPVELIAFNGHNYVPLIVNGVPHRPGFSQLGGADFNRPASSLETPSEALLHLKPVRFEPKGVAILGDHTNYMLRSAARYLCLDLQRDFNLCPY